MVLDTMLNADIGARPALVYRGMHPRSSTAGFYDTSLSSVFWVLPRFSYYLDPNIIFQYGRSGSSFSNGISGGMDE